MALEEVPEPAAGTDPNPQEQEQNSADEAADFVTSQVLDKDATFFEG